ncbi:hypothetical protein BCPG3_034 [Bacillus phage BCPG3]|uniref:Uncharacterized protein n=2 Tax=Wphvirus BPS13 TaxID=1987727 RepID=A0A173GBL2_9CAUD|nr:hypothetical protein SALINJAH_63 [Bacillus phage SalinJah]ANH50706.1 hypothetical protein SALINJAH_63 [Bacillus phage SalinJah]QQO38970.1 hypothetical protein BCPG1_239 [Bacillus phage BCPG1]QSJ04351.1 hypothetical protein BCPG3_034 [Bacillus phage BCPG3]
MDASFAVNYLIVKVIIIALLGYTLVLFFGVKKSVKDVKEEVKYSASIKKALSKLSYITNEIKGDDNMTKLDTQVEGVQNKLSLTELITRKASLTHYSEVVELVTKLVRNRYENYQFTIYPATDETQPNFIQIVSNWHDDPELHKLIFAKGIEYGIEMEELQKHFRKHIENGHVFDLGPDVVVITDDGSNSAPTNLSPINTGLEGSEVAVIVSFIEKAKYAGWVDKTFPLEERSEKLKLVVSN